jgi:hypothetical protein
MEVGDPAGLVFPDVCEKRQKNPLPSGRRQKTSKWRRRRRTGQMGEKWCLPHETMPQLYWKRGHEFEDSLHGCAPPDAMHARSS